MLVNFTYKTLIITIILKYSEHSTIVLCLYMWENSVFKGDIWIIVLRYRYKSLIMENNALEYKFGRKFAWNPFRENPSI